MTLPTTLKIGPYHYKVQISRTPFVSESGEASEGEINFQRGVIKITRTTPERMFATLMHEAIHGLSDVTDTGLTEEQCSRLGPALAAFLVDNGFVGNL